MKSRPILFSGPMVRAILEGRKTQTRRVVKPQPFQWAERFEPGPFKKYGRAGDWIQMTRDEHRQIGMARCPFGQPGDRLWVKETWQCVPIGRPAPIAGDNPIPKSLPDGWTVLYASSGDTVTKDVGWRPSIHMPRWASRITLEIEAVRVERLREISESDCRLEGCRGGNGSIPGYAFSATPREHYRHVWQSIHRPKLPANTRKRRYARVKRYLDTHPDMSWDANPWVWVVTFRRVNP